MMQGPCKPRFHGRKSAGASGLTRPRRVPVGRQGADRPREPCPGWSPSPLRLCPCSPARHLEGRGPLAGRDSPLPSRTPLPAPVGLPPTLCDSVSSPLSSHGRPGAPCWQAQVPSLSFLQGRAEAGARGA